MEEAEYGKAGTVEKANGGVGGRVEEGGRTVEEYRYMATGGRNRQ